MRNYTHRYSPLIYDGRAREDSAKVKACQAPRQAARHQRYSQANRERILEREKRACEANPQAMAERQKHNKRRRAWEAELAVVQRGSGGAAARAERAANRQAAALEAGGTESVNTESPCA